MTISFDDYDLLLRKISTASLDARKWIEVLEALTRVTGGAVRTHMFGFDGDGAQTLAPIYAGYDPDFTQAYDSYYHEMNAWAPGFAKAAEGEVIASQAMIPDDEIAKTEFYSDWVLPQEDIRVGGGVILRKRKDSMFAIGGNIRARDTDSMQGLWLDLVRRLTPHIQTALKTNEAMAELRLANHAFSELGGAPGAAVLLVNEGREIIYADAAAEAYFAQGSVLRTGRGRRLQFTAPEADRRFALCLRGLGEGGDAASATIPLAQGGARLICRCAPISAAELQTIMPLSASRGLLLVLAPAQSQTRARTVLQRDFRMSDAEVEIALLLAGGQDLAMIAEARGRSLHTIRNQVKSAMVKAGVHRQRDLALLAQALGR